MCRVEVAKALRYIPGHLPSTRIPAGSLVGGRTRQTTLLRKHRKSKAGGWWECRSALASRSFAIWAFHDLECFFFFAVVWWVVEGGVVCEKNWEEGEKKKQERKKESKSCFAGRRDGRKPGDWDFPHGSDHGRSCASWEPCISSSWSESDPRSNQAYSASQVHFSATHYGLACFHQGSYSHEVFARSSQAEAEGGHHNTKPFKWPSPISHHVLELSLFFSWEVFFTSSEGFAELHSWKNGFGVFSLDSIHVKNTDLEEALVVLQTLNAPSGGYALIVRQIWHKRKV